MLGQKLQVIDSGKSKNSCTQAVILTIIAIALVTILLVVFWKPKSIDRYLEKLRKIRESLAIDQKELVRAIADDGKLTSVDDKCPSHTQIPKRAHKYWKKLGNRIKDNLVSIVKSSKYGPDLIVDEYERKYAIGRLRKATIEETTIHDGTHTINKEVVYFCDPNHTDENTLAHVWIHEFAHVLNDTIGHDVKWQTLFDKLQNIAHAQKWFKRDAKLELSTYCGGKYNG